MRYACLGNGRLYLGWDSSCRLREAFWPAVGQSNHLQERGRNSLVVRFDNRFLDVGGHDFLTVGRYLPGMGFVWHLRHKTLPLKMKVTDYVDPYLPVWARVVEFPGGEDNRDRVTGVYTLLALALNENTIGEQGAWDRHSGRLYHFKGRTWVGAQATATGRRADVSLGGPAGSSAVRAAVAKVRDGGIGFQEATGEVTGHSVDHGLIESALGLTAQEGIAGPVEFLLAFGADRSEADRNLDAASHADAVQDRSRNYWRGLLAGGDREAPGATSVKIAASHCDRGGGVIASCDTDILGDHRDHYCYVWPRDAAMCASALLKVGFPGYARRYIEYCARALSPLGCFWQRYRPDASRGSGWHPWDLPGGELPVQEDETALSLITAGDYLELGRDLDAVNSVYLPFIQKAARFILGYRMEGGLLVRPSFDLWEERKGVFSFTEAACAGGLSAASRIASALGREDEAREFAQGAVDLMRGLALHLSSADRGFCRSLTGLSDNDSRFDKDWTDDASLFMVPLLLPAPATAPLDAGETLESLFDRSAVTWRRLKTSLAVRLPGTEAPGYARYSGDWYQRPQGATGSPGNPWPVTTAWFALSGLNLGLLERGDALEYLRWFDSVTSESGLLPEQLSATTGEPLSVSPLAWSHAMHLALFAASGELLPPNTPALAGER